MDGISIKPAADDDIEKVREGLSILKVMQTIRFVGRKRMSYMTQFTPPYLIPHSTTEHDSFKQGKLPTMIARRQRERISGEAA
jgi:hypothetical protein